MEHYEKEIELLKRLYARTEQGAVNWYKTDQEEVYLAQFPEYDIQILQRWLDENEDTYDTYLSILDKNGVLLESFSDTMISQSESIGSDAFLFMRDLFSMARRIALGVEQALDNLIEYLAE